MSIKIKNKKSKFLCKNLLKFLHENANILTKTFTFMLLFPIIYILYIKKSYFKFL